MWGRNKPRHLLITPAMPHAGPTAGGDHAEVGLDPNGLQQPQIISTLPLFCHLLFVTLSIFHLLGQTGAASQPVKTFRAHPSGSPGRQCTDLQYQEKVKLQKKRKSAALNTAHQAK